VALLPFWVLAEAFLIVYNFWICSGYAQDLDNYPRQDVLLKIIIKFYNRELELLQYIELAHWQQMNVGELCFSFASFAEVAGGAVFFFTCVPTDLYGFWNRNV